MLKKMVQTEGPCSNVCSEMLKITMIVWREVFVFFKSTEPDWVRPRGQREASLFNENGAILSADSG